MLTYDGRDYEPRRSADSVVKERLCFFSPTCIHFQKAPAPLPHKPTTRRKVLENLENDYFTFIKKVNDSASDECAKSAGFSNWTCCEKHKELHEERKKLHFRAETLFIFEENPFHPLTEEWFTYERERVPLYLLD